MGKGRRAVWDERTQSITGAMAKGAGVWEAIEGWTEPKEEVQRSADGQFPEWAVPIGRIRPRPRRSILDYAEVREVGPDCTSWQRVAPWRPDRGSPSAPDGACAGMEIIDVKIAAQSTLVQNVTPEMADRDGGNIVRNVLASMRDEILLDVESEVRARLAETKREDGPGYELYVQNTKKQGGDDKVVLSARHILEAGRCVAGAHPHAGFPRGLFCLLSPSQALQLLREGDLDAKSMSVCGIDAVVSPLPGRRTDLEARSAMVAVKGSVSVAMIRVRIRMAQVGGAYDIEASYDMGAEIVPRMTARLVTEMGAGDLVL